MADNQPKNASEEDHSIEEILSSIRRIISDDDEAPKTEQKTEEKPVAAEAAPAPVEVEADVEESVAFEEPVALETEPEVIEEDIIEDDVLELTEVVPEEDSFEPEPVPEPIVEPAPEPVPEPPKEEVDIFLKDIDEDVISEEVAQTALGSMSKLASEVKEAKHDADKPLSHIDVTRITLEEIVRQEVKPIIKNWLDVNLPSLVERIVEREIAKLRSRIED